MLKNFAVNVCKARADWQMENFTSKEIERIRKLVGPKAQVVCFLPGTAATAPTAIFGALPSSLLPHTKQSFIY